VSGLLNPGRLNDLYNKEVMIDKEEYQNVIRAAYSLYQQIYDMELSGAITYAQLREQALYHEFNPNKVTDGSELAEELTLLYILVTAKNSFPGRFLDSCRSYNAPTT